MLHSEKSSINFATIATINESAWMSCLTNSISASMAQCFKNALEQEKNNLQKELSGLSEPDKSISQNRIVAIDSFLSGDAVLKYSDEIISLQQNLEKQRQLFNSIKNKTSSDNLLLQQIEADIALKMRNQINKTFNVGEKFGNLAQDYPDFVREFYALGPKTERGVVLKSRDLVREEYIKSYIEKNFPNLSPAQKELYIDNLTFGTYTENFLQYVYKPQNINGNDFSLFEKYLPYLCQNNFFSTKDDALVNFAKLHMDIGNCAIGMNERLSNAIDNSKNPIKNIRQMYLFLLSKHTLPLQHPGHEIHRTSSLNYFLGIPDSDGSLYLTEFTVDAPNPILQDLYLKTGPKNFLHDLYFTTLKDYYKDFFKNPSMDGSNDKRFLPIKESIKNFYSIAAKISNYGFEVGDWAKLYNEPEISATIIYNDDFDAIKPQSEIDALVKQYGGIEEVASIAATQFLNKMEEAAIIDPAFAKLIIDAETKKRLQQVSALKFLSMRDLSLIPIYTSLTTNQFLNDFQNVFDYTEKANPGSQFDNYKLITLKESVEGFTSAERSRVNGMLSDIRLVENENGKFFLNSKLMELLVIKNINLKTLTQEGLNSVFAATNDYKFNLNFSQFENPYSIVFKLNCNDWIKTKMNNDVLNNNKIKIQSFYELYYFLNNPLSPWNMQNNIPFGSAEWTTPRSSIEIDMEVDLSSAKLYNKAHIEKNIFKDQMFELAESRPHLIEQIQIIKQSYGSGVVFFEFLSKATQGVILPSELVYIDKSGKTTFETIFVINQQKAMDLLSKIPNETITLDLLSGNFGYILKKYDNARYHTLIESIPNEHFTLDILKSDWWNDVSNKHANKSAQIYILLKNQIQAMGITDVEGDFGKSIFHHEPDMFVDLISKIPDHEIKFKHLIGPIGKAIEIYDQNSIDDRFDRLTAVTKIENEYLSHFEELYKAFLDSPNIQSNVFDSKIISLLSSRHANDIYNILEKYKDHPNSGQRNDYLTRTWVDFWPNLALQDPKRFLNFFENYPNYYKNCFFYAGGSTILSKGTPEQINIFLDKAITVKNHDRLFFATLERFNIIEKFPKKFLDIVIQDETNLGKETLKNNSNALKRGLKTLTGLDIEVNDNKFKIYTSNSKISETFDIKKLSEALTGEKFFENFPPAKFGANIFFSEIGLSLIEESNQEKQKIYLNNIEELKPDQLQILLKDEVIVRKLIDLDFKRFIDFFPKDSNNQPILTSDQRILIEGHLTKKLNQNIVIRGDLAVLTDTNPDITKAKSYNFDTFGKKMKGGLLTNPCKTNPSLRSKRSNIGTLCITPNDLNIQNPENINKLNDKLQKGGLLSSDLSENIISKPGKTQSFLVRTAGIMAGLHLFKALQNDDIKSAGFIAGGITFSFLVQEGANKLYITVASKATTNFVKIGAKTIPVVGNILASTPTLISLLSNWELYKKGDKDAAINMAFDATSIAIDVGIAILVIASGSTMGPAGVGLGLVLALGQETYHAASRAADLGETINLSKPEHIAAFVRYFIGINESEENLEHIAIKSSTLEYISSTLATLKTFLESQGFTTVILPEGKTIVENLYISESSTSCQTSTRCSVVLRRVLQDRKITKEPGENAETNVVIGDISSHEGFVYFESMGGPYPITSRKIDCLVNPKANPGDNYLNLIDDKVAGYGWECVPAMHTSKRKEKEIAPIPSLKGKSEKEYYQARGRVDSEYPTNSSQCHNAHILNKSLQSTNPSFENEFINPKGCIDPDATDRSGGVFAYLYNKKNKLTVNGIQANKRPLYLFVRGGKTAEDAISLNVEGPSQASTSGFFSGFITGVVQARKSGGNAVDLREFMKSESSVRFELKSNSLKAFETNQKSGKGQSQVVLTEWQNPNIVYLREGSKDDFYYINQSNDSAFLRIDTLGGEKYLNLQNAIAGDGGNINMIIDLYGGEYVVINNFTPVINVKNDFNINKRINIDYNNKASEKRLYVKIDSSFSVESVKLFFRKTSDGYQFTLQSINGREVCVTSDAININFEFNDGLVMLPSVPQSRPQNSNELQPIASTVLYVNPKPNESLDAFKKRIVSINNNNIKYIKYGNYDETNNAEGKIEFIFGTLYNEVFQSLNPDSDTVYFIDSGGENAFKIPAHGKKTIIEIGNNEVKNVLSFRHLNAEYGKIEIESYLQPNTDESEFYDTVLTFKSSDGKILDEKVTITRSAQLQNGVPVVLLKNLQIDYNDRQIGYLRLMEGGSSANLPNFYSINEQTPATIEIKTLYDVDTESYVATFKNEEANKLILIYSDHDILNNKISHIKFENLKEESLTFSKEGNDLIVIGQNQDNENVYYVFKDFRKIIEHSNGDSKYQLNFTIKEKTYPLSEVQEYFQKNSFTKNIIDDFNNEATYFQVKKSVNTYNDLIRVYPKGKLMVIDLEGYNLASSVITEGLTQDAENFGYKETLVLALEDLETKSTQLIHLPGFNKKANSNILIIFNNGNIANLNNFYEESRSDISHGEKTNRLRSYLGGFEVTTTKPPMLRNIDCQPKKSTIFQIYDVKTLAEKDWAGVNIKHNYCGENNNGIVDITGYEIYTAKVVDASESDKEFYADKEDLHLVLINKETNESQILIIHGLLSSSEKNKNQFNLEIRLHNGRKIFLKPFQTDANKMNTQYDKTLKFNEIVEYKKPYLETLSLEEQILDQFSNIVKNTNSKPVAPKKRYRRMILEENVSSETEIKNIEESNVASSASTNRKGLIPTLSTAISYFFKPLKKSIPMPSEELSVSSNLKPSSELVENFESLNSNLNSNKRHIEKPFKQELNKNEPENPIGQVNKCTTYLIKSNDVSGKIELCHNGVSGKGNFEHSFHPNTNYTSEVSGNVEMVEYDELSLNPRNMRTEEIWHNNNFNVDVKRTQESHFKSNQFPHFQESQVPNEVCVNADISTATTTILNPENYLKHHNREIAEIRYTENNNEGTDTKDDTAPFFVNPEFNTEILNSLVHRSATEIVDKTFNSRLLSTGACMISCGSLKILPSAIKQISMQTAEKCGASVKLSKILSEATAAILPSIGIFIADPALGTLNILKSYFVKNVISAVVSNVLDELKVKFPDQFEEFERFGQAIDDGSLFLGKDEEYDIENDDDSDRYEKGMRNLRRDAIKDVASAAWSVANTATNVASNITSTTLCTAYQISARISNCFVGSNDTSKSSATSTQSSALSDRGL